MDFDFLLFMNESVEKNALIMCSIQDERILDYQSNNANKLCKILFDIALGFLSN
jgi:hypothetical protein